MQTHYIAHRINTAAELREIPTEFGLELDLRDRGERLILQHDPFQDGEDFEKLLEVYEHGTMILNIKSERIEHRVLELLAKYKVTDYFFLDSSFPMIVTLARSGEHKLALRFSEFEQTDTIFAMAGKARWVWVDCFSRLPITKELADEFRAQGFQLCLVSPELQGRPDDIEAYRAGLENDGIQFDAICTKVHNVDRWRK